MDYSNKIYFQIAFWFNWIYWKKLWHHFDTSVFRYWIDPTLIICSTSYKEILKDILKTKKCIFLVVKKLSQEF